MPKMLLLAPRIGGVGGIAQHVRQLAKRLKMAGWSVHLLSSELMELKMRKGVVNIEYSISSAAKCLGRFYDVVHGHNLPSILALRIVKARAKILTLHGVYSKQIELLHGSVLGCAARLAEKILLRWVDKITVVTEDAANYYRSLGFDAEYIPNAIDFSELPAERRRIITPQITYLGRLSREKGVDILLKVASMGVRGIVIAGDGPMRPLVKRASKEGLIHYLGPLPRPEALKVLAGSDIFILPSRAEGLSTALLEAMALKIPIIATRVGGNIEVIRNGVDGVLMEPSPERIYEAITHLLENRDEAERLAENAHRKALTQYSWQKAFNQYLNLYQTLLGR